MGGKEAIPRRGTHMKEDRAKSQHAWGTARPYKLGEEIRILSWRQGAWGTIDILERICYLQCREWAGRSKTEERRQFRAYYRQSMKRDWKKETAVSTRRRWHQDEGNIQGLCHPCDEEKEDGWLHPTPDSDLGGGLRVGDIHWDERCWVRGMRAEVDELKCGWRVFKGHQVEICRRYRSCWKFHEQDLEGKVPSEYPKKLTALASSSSSSSKPSSNLIF